MTDARAQILARRARFVAAALTGLGALACARDPAPPPEPCLSQPMQPEPDARSAEPEVCLSVEPEPDQPPPPPQPCLSPPLPEKS
jgi:hypothetical protein